MSRGRWEWAAATWAGAEFSGLKKRPDPGIGWSAPRGRARLCLPASAQCLAQRTKRSRDGLRPAAGLTLFPPVRRAIAGWRVRVRSLSVWLGPGPGMRLGFLPTGAPALGLEDPLSQHLLPCRPHGDFSLHSFGLAPAAPLQVHAPLSPNQTVEISLPLNTVGSVMKMEPLNNLQVCSGRTKPLIFTRAPTPGRSLVGRSGACAMCVESCSWPHMCPGGLSRGDKGHGSQGRPVRESDQVWGTGVGPSWASEVGPSIRTDSGPRSQVAVKNNIDVFYFSTLYPLHILFVEDGKMGES